MGLSSINREGEMKSWLALFRSVSWQASRCPRSPTMSTTTTGNKRQRVFRAQLIGLNEVPSVSTPARGEFYAIVNEAGTAFTYWLSYSGLAFDAAQGAYSLRPAPHQRWHQRVAMPKATVPAPASVAANVPPCPRTGYDDAHHRDRHGCRRYLGPGGPRDQRRRFRGAAGCHARWRGLRERAFGRSREAPRA